MPKASYAQSSFLGGEWAPTMQGRIDRPDYKAAMNLCRNALPIEQGSWNRRPGSRFAATTRGAAAGRVMPFAIEQNAPYVMEHTNGYMRLHSGARGYFDVASTNDAQPVTSISTATPAVVTTQSAHGWSSGNQVKFLFSGAKAATCALLQNRHFVITVVSSTTFSLADAITGAAIVGADLVNGTSPTGLSVMRILEFQTPYTNSAWASLRAVQAVQNLLPVSVLLHGSYAPEVVTVTGLPANGNDATFTLSPVDFQDGPYLDQPEQTQITITGGSHSVTVFVAFQTYSSSVSYGVGDMVTDGSNNNWISLQDGNLNNTPSSSPTYWSSLPYGAPVNVQQTGFQSSDVGRHFRIFNEPPLWSASTQYSLGAVVKDPQSFLYYTAIISSPSEGDLPSIMPTQWAQSPNAAQWLWGRISSVTDKQTVVVALVEGEQILYDTTNTSWQLGLYSASTGWPTCGVWYDGRLWLAGAALNRFDGSVPDQPYVFSPTQPDGTVTDDCAISETLNATGDVNTILWLEDDQAGIIAGTEGGEWLISSGTAGQPITPTSITAHRVTKYGGANMLPARTGLTHVFVQRYQRNLLEYFADVFSGRFTAPNLSLTASHLTVKQIEEICFQQTLAPVIWGRCGDGSLIGCTYRRDSMFSSQGPNFAGWHAHSLGSGRSVESICIGPSIDGTLDTLAMTTLDPATGYYHVETLTSLFDPSYAITEAWFVDDGVVPGANGAHGGTVQTLNGKTTVTFNGLWHLNGKTVSVFACGVDCGDYQVNNGAIQIVCGVGAAVNFTKALIGSLSTSGTNFGVFATVLDNLDDPTGTTTYTIPAVVGFTYTSQGQLLRPIIPQEAGTPLGPALGKTRRTHMYGLLVRASAGLSVGTDFAHMNPAAFATPDGTPYAANELYSGVWWDTVDDDYSFDSMLAWQVTRPYPAIVCLAEGFLETQER